MLLNEITHEILDSSYKVHSALGPGLLESAYKVIISVKLYNAIRSKVYNENGDQFVTQK